MGKFQDLTGQRFGRLTVIKRAKDHITPKGKKKTVWYCRCDCGAYVFVEATSLKQNRTKSCGCLLKESSKQRFTTHGDSKTRLYKVWCGIKERCYNPYNKRYKDYGGRGIVLCDEWHDYTIFKEWAYNNGYNENAKQGECTIERINNNKNYEPNNCIWTNMKLQGNNRRNNRLLTFQKETHTMSEWAEITGIKRETIRGRIDKYGWDVESTLKTPI